MESEFFFRSHEYMYQRRVVSKSESLIVHDVTR